MENLFKIIAKELELKADQVKNTVSLLDEGATVPFIARYRKEMTGSLDEIAIGKIQETINYLRNLEKRKEEVIRLIDEQGKLTEELQKAINAAEKLQEVEDFYFPYRKKRKTKADIAKERGLEPLAVFLLEGHPAEKLLEKAEEFMTEEVPSAEEALEGAKLIIAQDISEKAEYREKVREEMLKYGMLISKNSKKAAELDTKKVYGDYYEYSEPVSKIPSHRILAVNRGEKEDILSVSLNLDEKARDRVENNLLREFGKGQATRIYKEIVVDSLDRLIVPSIEREVRNILTEKAEEEAIKVFKENLKNLLLQSPLKEKAILALDPGYRTGCKTAVINREGFYETDDVLFLVPGIHNPRQIEEAKKKVLNFIDRYNIDIIAIGNGTASRETEGFIAELIRENRKLVKYIIVNEAGASIYSASKIASEEFPNLDVTVRGAISIGRRIQDPLAELVKIDPKSIGVGMYQHDVNQKRLDDSLDEVIDSVVNSVGINVNTASWALLSHVSGIKKNIAKNIEDYRKENSSFKNRKELLKVKGIGAKAYEQMAGFLVIQEGENPLDNTIIHPESYHIAAEILEMKGFKPADLKESLVEIREKLQNFQWEKFATEKGYGQETVKDIYQALIRERRDPRDDLEKPLLKSDILNINNLKPGMELEGTVRNVVKFGAFVDIGLKNDALLHISEISDRFIDDPSKVLAVGQIIKVKVKEIDRERERVALTKKGL